MKTSLRQLADRSFQVEYNLGKGGRVRQVEVVRLVHGHGVPHHYIANQVYQPSDEMHRRGTFLWLIHQTDTPSGAFLASLTSALVRDYFRPGAPTGIDGFEHALLRVNEQLKHHPAHTDTQIGSFNGAIALYHDEEIHLTFIGHTSAYLLRDQAFLRLNEDTNDNPATAGFSLITSGEIKPDDLLILATGLSPNQTPAKWEDSLTFATGHTPLYEAGRAMARIFKLEDERLAEAQLITFNQSELVNQTVTVDGSLETTSEKIERFNKIGQGLWQHVQKQAQRIHQTSKTAIKQLNKTPTDVSVPSSLDAEPPVLTETSISPDSPKMNDIMPAASPPHEEFAVTTYWQKLTGQTTPEATPEDDLTTRAAQPVTAHFLKLTRLKPRIAYLLGGTLVILFIVVQIFNQVAGPPPKETSAPERDALLATAEAASREADAAQIQDDISKAIEKLIEAQTSLGKISPGLQNEKSRTLTNRTEELLAKLTKTGDIGEVNASATSTTPITRIVVASNATYLFDGASPAQKLKDTALSRVDLSGLSVSDAVAFDNGQKVAVVGKSDRDTKLYQINTDNDQVSELTRSDNKAWPETKFIANFETNLYLAGTKVTKAVSAGDFKYRIVNFAGDATTGELTTFVNNGFAFYAIEGDHNLVRIAANSPKTPVKIFGVPDSFLPKKITRVMSTSKEGLLYLFDPEGKRLIQITTDGGYRLQFRLPQNKTYRDCAIRTTTLVCADSDQKVYRYQLPE